MNFTKFNFAGNEIQRSMFASAISSVQILKMRPAGHRILPVRYAQEQTSKGASGYKVDIFGCKLQDAKISAGGGVAAGKFEDQIAVENIQIEKPSNAYNSPPTPMPYAWMLRNDQYSDIAAETGYHTPPLFAYYTAKGAFYGCIPERH